MILMIGRGREVDSRCWSRHSGSPRDLSSRRAFLLVFYGVLFVLAMFLSCLWSSVLTCFAILTPVSLVSLSGILRCINRLGHTKSLRIVSSPSRPHCPLII